MSLLSPGRDKLSVTALHRIALCNMDTPLPQPLLHKARCITLAGFIERNGEHATQALSTDLEWMAVI